MCYYCAFQGESLIRDTEEPSFPYYEVGFYLQNHLAQLVGHTNRQPLAGDSDIEDALMITLDLATPYVGIHPSKLIF